MKKISLLIVLLIASLLLVIKASWASNEINLATLSSTDIVAATPIPPTLKLANHEPVLVGDAGHITQNQIDKAELVAIKTKTQEVQKQQDDFDVARNQKDNGLAIIALTAFLSSPFVFYFLYFQRRTNERRSYINTYSFPDTVLKNFCQQHPLLGPWQVRRVVAGLKQYFCCCAPSPEKSVPMPSRLINDLWRVFSLQRKDYEDFCQNAFRYKLHYQVIDELARNSKANDNMWVIWQYACSTENQDSWSPTLLPSIFAIDADLNIQDGFYYDLAICAKKWGLDPATCC